jgi:hypothetical protein
LRDTPTACEEVNRMRTQKDDQACKQIDHADLRR